MIQIFSLACSPGFCTPILYALREFHYIDLKMNWADAQQYCREKYTDLATIESMADNNRLKGTEHSQAWIGLHDDPLSWKGIGGNERNSWRWSSTGEFTERDNHNWKKHEPNNARAKQHCVVMNSDTSLDDDDCNREFDFVCYNGKIHLATEKQTAIHNAHVPHEAATLKIIYEKSIINKRKD
uniref:C-type lectin domain-containing protein n=1 Tax=Labrus bergylta TaxID=56723 RepID=A0A3Q3GHB4_9LABR